MKKQLPALFIATLLTFGMVLAGCKKKTETSASILPLGETYVSYKEGQSFYVMRIGNDYVRLPGTGDKVLADDSGELPDLEDGQFAYITATVKDVYYDFGFVPQHTYYISSISSSEYLSYKEIIDRCNIPELGTTEDSSLFQYTQDDVLYILVLHGNVFAYTDNGKFGEYVRQDRVYPFEQFLSEVGK